MTMDGNAPRREGRMTDNERQTYADDPEMLGLIQSVGAHEIKEAVLNGEVKVKPECMESTACIVPSKSGSRRRKGW